MGKVIKSPLRYQMSEFDCLPTSIMNALSHLFPISKISGELIKMIYCFSMDDIDDYGRIRGTETDAAVKALKASGQIKYKILSSEQVTAKLIENCLRDKGVAVCGIYDMRREGHTSLVTRHDSEWVYIWDPYPYGEDVWQKINDKDIEIIRNETTANVRVRRERFYSVEKKRFSLGEKKDRWCYLIWRKNLK